MPGWGWKWVAIPAAPAGSCKRFQRPAGGLLLPVLTPPVAFVREAFFHFRCSWAIAMLPSPGSRPESPDRQPNGVRIAYPLAREDAVLASPDAIHTFSGSA